jgi:hypothetical protein
LKHSNLANPFQNQHQIIIQNTHSKSVLPENTQHQTYLEITHSANNHQQ